MSIRNITLGAAAITLAAASLQAGRPLDHDAFDAWQRVENHLLSDNGQWAAYALRPQEGDATLTLYNLKTGRRIDIQRGYQPAFTADSRYALVMVRPLFEETRRARINKKEGLDMPQDSLAIVNLATGKVEMTPRVVSYRIGKDGGNWVAYQSVDTLLAPLKKLKEKEAGKPLIVRNPEGTVCKQVNWVKDYAFSRDGNRLAMSISRPATDSITTNGIGLINLPDTSFTILDRDRLHYGTPVFSEDGLHLAFIADNDSSASGTRRAMLFMADTSSPMNGAREISLALPVSAGPRLQRPHSSDPATQSRLIEEWQRRNERSRDADLHINQYSEPRFSHDGRRLVIGVAPHIMPDDTTIVDFETAALDIWRWDAPHTPPQEKNNLEQTRKKQYPVVIDIKSGHNTLIDSTPLATVFPPDRWDADWAMVADPTEHQISRQWNYIAPEKISLVNVTTGERRELGFRNAENYDFSPAGKYVVWFDGRNFHSYATATGDTACITRDIPVELWDVDDDHPAQAPAYGFAAWLDNDSRVLIYDKYDIWSVDPAGIAPSVCITAGEGRRKGLTYRYIRTDPEARSLKPGETMLLSVFDNADKRQGLATLKADGKSKAPTLEILDKASFSQIKKARHADSFTWQRASFEIKPDIWGVTSAGLDKAKRISDSNPQMADYSWGTASLMEWTAYDGSKAQGVLYLPENFDETKEYPMLAVFYETGSENLYRHYTMEPSWSWVNYPFYVSRGYVVFVPDIHYTAGIPGECAYNYVCSGVEAVCDRYPNIDRSRIGIDGQSWGGYQTAYLVTRTNMFACAGSGAPVSNMTSAFGGIRWESGDSRQAQYEMGQSRIGRNLWEAPELYIANSPLFHADRCHTPLLIMHNDADGAVPWYQGIEMFRALRRLQRPVWMLQYNGEAHNLRERKNRKDITIRLQQFFDHYLKGDPMPEWMEKGIPAIRKGQEMGY